MTKLTTFMYPIERKFSQFFSRFIRLTRSQTTSFIFLLLSIAIAICLVNSPWNYLYEGLLKLPIRLQIGSLFYEDTLVNWVNDILMVLFFFMLGLELKRELLVGELRTPKLRNFVIFTSLGGVLFPALIYLILNHGGDFAFGWGIPMSTDTPFTIGLLALLGERVPKQLLILLIAISVFDDIATVLVLIASGSENIALSDIGVILLPISALIFTNIIGIRSPLPYVVLGIILLILLQNMGLHATSIAGLLVAFTVPARAQYAPHNFAKIASQIIKRFNYNRSANTHVLQDDEQHLLLENLHRISLKSTTPLQHWKGLLHTPVGLMIIPLFSLLNAGVTIDMVSMHELISHPISLSITSGLIVGKFTGIVSMAWLTLKLKIGTLPTKVKFKHIIGLGLVSGIGFSMAIFAARTAFGDGSHELMLAKLSIIATALISILFTTLWFCIVCRK